MDTITPTEAQKLAREGAILLDVREADEWSAGHAPEALHIPLGELEARRAELAQPRVVLTVCRSGARSAKAQTILIAAGLDARNVEGGMRAWQQAGLPMESQSAAVATVI